MRRARQRGAILILYAFALVVILGFAGLVLDLGLVYFRKAQLQGAADAIALAAAQRLNGTAAGVATAVTAAATNAATHRVGLADSLPWNADAALRFNSSPDAAGGWLSAGEAAAAPAGIWYARVDIGALASTAHVMRPIFMGLVGADSPIDVGAAAVAGQAALKVTPLAICALKTQQTTQRDNGGGLLETITYGFRTGVTYNLLNLNPALGASSGAYFFLDPLAPPGTVATADTSTDAVVAPFLCSGTLAYGSLGTGTTALAANLRRLEAFHLAAQLNSRFGQYAAPYSGTNACVRNGAPPDTNVKNYAGAGATWHPTDAQPTQPSARSSSGAGLPLATIADLSPAQTFPAGHYGIRWAFAQPARPDGTLIGRNSWNTLYPPTVAVANTPTWTSTPYKLIRETPDPATPSRAERRVLTVPLLDCSTVPPSGLATVRVLALGRFLLSAPATDSEVPGEFGGVLTQAQTDRLRTVEIFR
ncbi:putative Flp pilus-assembly TadE/G-like protein [Pseudoduganella lurida]|uniref:Putative Flp pilus-assembly TadE/G-like protein n=2 Tax=Pseudoduganella lurida TaxID=1036180 RepID=A0A562R3P7_9BURK|nr:putative Flp pilus-assembly TadE/G-like protein [Pseudoduganella lurida]